MNPLDELNSLTRLFPGERRLIRKAEHLPAALVPQPYKDMLDHDRHMTVTMEKYHGIAVDVNIIARQLDDDNIYTRKIILTKTGTDNVVQFGIVRFHFQYVTREVRDEIIKGETPLGRILINHNVLRHIDLGALLRITAGEELAEHLQMPAGDVTYGRLATIFCNRQPAVDLLEISAPLSATE